MRTFMIVQTVPIVFAKPKSTQKKTTTFFYPRIKPDESMELFLSIPTLPEFSPPSTSLRLPISKLE